MIETWLTLQDSPGKKLVDILNQPRFQHMASAIHLTVELNW